MTDCPIDAVDHIEIHVEGQHDAAKWYEKIFGFKIINELEFWSKAKSGPLFVGNKDKTVKLALFEGTKDGDGSIKRVAFRASGKNFVGFVNGLEQNPVYHSKQKITAKDLVDHDICYSIYFEDPYGNNLEITCYDYAFVTSKLSDVKTKQSQ